MTNHVEVTIEELAKQEKGALKGSDVTVTGYLIKAPQEPLDDGFNYPLIDENMNGVLIRSPLKLDNLRSGKWYRVKGKIDAANEHELHVTEDADVEEAEKQPELPTKTRQFSSSVDRIVDGDTLHLKEPVLGTTKVRMVSIDTPEKNYQGDSQGYYAEEATRRLQALLPEGEDVTIRVGDEAFDAYDRLLGVVWKGEQNINKEMILIGMAVPYFIYPNLLNFEAYGKAVVKAQECERGIWNPERPLHELPYEFRFNKRGGPDKYVGNYETKEYVTPEKWESVPIELRVFFFEENDAKEAGYTLKSEDDSDAPCGC